MNRLPFLHKKYSKKIEKGEGLLRDSELPDLTLRLSVLWAGDWTNDFQRFLPSQNTLQSFALMKLLRGKGKRLYSEDHGGVREEN